MFDIVIAAFFLLFMFLVDWRLNRIYEELRTLNETMRAKPESGPESS